MKNDSSALTVMQRCDILAGYSEEPDRLTRRFASPPMHQVNTVVGAWMQQAGMSVQQDAIGNLIGHYAAQTPEANTLLLGSHLDSVRDAGRYDGPLGVMVALACIERLQARQQRLAFHVDVVGFADEEGLRYHTAYLGSAFAAGTFDRALLTRHDADGIAMADAIRAAGGDPDVYAVPHWQPEKLLGYCEVHIEQGPVLEARRLPVGIVSAISGQSRSVISLIGEAGHAGTVPMDLRHDAICAAAEFVLSVEELARKTPGLVATVGQLAVQPGASNVIPGQVTLSLDVRHQDDSVCTRAYQELQALAHQIANQRGITLSWQLLQESRTIACTPGLIKMLERSITELGYPLSSLPSGAGHDGVILSSITDIAMLFVRCRGGISHNPAESVTQEDVAIAIDVLERFLLLIDEDKG